MHIKMIIASCIMVLMSCQAQTQKTMSAAEKTMTVDAATQKYVPAKIVDGQLQKVIKSDEEWKKELTSEEFNILREAGTERSFSGDLWDHKDVGTYTCAACGLPLFASFTKFKSGTGWPSYYEPIAAENVAEKVDSKYGWNRVEVVCARCEGHLGHVFEDGPQPTGLRYCINSYSLDFIKENP